LGDTHRQIGRRIYSEHPNLNTVEWYQSPLGTQAGMKVEPEWFYQRGGDEQFSKPMITPDLMNLYQDEESDYFYNRGGIASLGNRPGYAFAGVVDQNAPLQNWITRKPDINGLSGNEWITRKNDINNNQNINEWITRKPDINGLSGNEWITRKPDINEWITKKPDINEWITRKDIENLEEENQWIQRKAYGGAVGLEPGIGSLMGRI
jgi:hypothetical protein